MIQYFILNQALFHLSLGSTFTQIYNVISLFSVGS